MNTPAAPQNRTIFAQKAVDMGAIFQGHFESRKYGSSVQRAAQLQVLDVETTGSGKQARETILLVAKGSGSQRYPNVVCGYADIGQSTVELRPYDAVAQTYQERHQAALDVEESAFRAFQNDLRDFFQKQGFSVADVQEEAAKPAGGSNKTVLLVGVALLVIAAVAFFLTKS